MQELISRHQEEAKRSGNRCNFTQLRREFNQKMLDAKETARQLHEAQLASGLLQAKAEMEKREAANFEAFQLSVAQGWLNEMSAQQLRLDEAASKDKEAALESQAEVFNKQQKEKQDEYDKEISRLQKSIDYWKKSAMEWKNMKLHDLQDFRILLVD